MASFETFQVMCSCTLLLNVRKVFSEGSDVLIAAQAAARALFSDELQRGASSCCSGLLMMKVSVEMTTSIGDSATRYTIHLHHGSAAIKDQSRMIIFETNLVVCHE